MDRLKAVQEDPDQRKKALKSTLCSDSLHLALCIAMVVVGAQVGYKSVNIKLYTEIFMPPCFIRL